MHAPHSHDNATLETLTEHHGHLGGFDVLGFKAGQWIMHTLGARPYFGLAIVVWCPPQPPPSCLLDGLQLATGCSVAKGNLSLRPAAFIKVRAISLDSGARLVLQPRCEALAWVQELTRQQGADAAGRWAWERAPEELWEAVELRPNGQRQAAPPPQASR
jgi:formylmethanofuran dehydrogenase subunit E